MKAPVSLTADELLAVLGKARERRLRDCLIFASIYWHGFRVSEVVPSSTRQLGLFFTREKAEERKRQADASGSCGTASIQEVDRRVKGKPRTCYLVLAEKLVRRPGLTPEAIEGREITVQRLKGSMETVQVLEEHSNPLLNEKLLWEEWLAEGHRYGKKGGSKRQQNNVLLQSGQNGSIFHISRSQVNRLWKGYARAAGLPRRKQHPHCLKHTLGTDLVESGMSLPKVQVRLGHKSLGSTGQYTLPKEDAVSREVGRAIRGKDEFRPYRQGSLFEK